MDDVRGNGDRGQGYEGLGHPGRGAVAERVPLGHGPALAEDPSSHDPMDWVLEWGRYDRERWLSGWQELFDTQELLRNVRET